MKQFFLSLFAGLLVLFSGHKTSDQAKPVVTPSPEASISATIAVSPTRGMVSRPTAAVIPTVTPTSRPAAPVATRKPEPTHVPNPTPTSAPSFTPIVTSGTFRSGAGNCTENPSGTYTFEIVNYHEADNITDVKIRISVHGLKPNTRYVLNVGSASQLGGPSVTTDGAGSADFNFDNGGYTVNYKEIYSISIDDPEKIYPDNSCLLDDLKKGGVGLRYRMSV